ncbi:MAG: hypothetical protein R3E65_12790 [Steroidobacteraceae bacterium]
MLAAFALQGTLIGLAGTLGGAALGALVSLNAERLVSLSRQWSVSDSWTRKVYFMNELPAFIQWQDVLQVWWRRVSCCARSRRCIRHGVRARVSPAEALRHD